MCAFFLQTNDIESFLSFFLSFLSFFLNSRRKRKTWDLFFLSFCLSLCLSVYLSFFLSFFLSFSILGRKRLAWDPSVWGLPGPCSSTDDLRTSLSLCERALHKASQLPLFSKREVKYNTYDVRTSPLVVPGNINQSDMKLGPPTHCAH